MIDQVGHLAATLDTYGPWAMVALMAVLYVAKDMETRKIRKELLDFAVQAVAQHAEVVAIIRHWDISEADDDAS